MSQHKTAAIWRECTWSELHSRIIQGTMMIRNAFRALRFKRRRSAMLFLSTPNFGFWVFVIENILMVHFTSLKEVVFEPGLFHFSKTYDEFHSSVVNLIFKQYRYFAWFCKKLSIILKFCTGPSHQTSWNYVEFLTSIANSKAENRYKTWYNFKSICFTRLHKTFSQAFRSFLQISNAKHI